MTSQRLSEEEIEELQRLYTEASEGTWYVTGDIEPNRFHVYTDPGSNHYCVFIADAGIYRPDAELIAASRNALPKLITELTESRATIEGLTTERDSERQRVERLEDGVTKAMGSARYNWELYTAERDNAIKAELRARRAEVASQALQKRPDALESGIREVKDGQLHGANCDVANGVCEPFCTIAALAALLTSPDDRQVQS